MILGYIIAFDIVPDIIGYLLVFLGLVELYAKTGEDAFGRAKIFALWMTLSAIFDVLMVSFKLIHLTTFPSYGVMNSRSARRVDIGSLLMKLKGIYGYKV